ncbi:hypothetical protein R3W88_012091 [Solanum pinnatisectum]|uniref:PB1-like domain-containing protein n=1 Tax=Solanum pinnatisectum TaxID=50273 RepID=A0AAV9L9C2_9SOLN|nr:hypothetical protein R3W88_012091 [Solanum pinnatisectum]
MTLTIVTLQFHYGGCFVSDPTLRYANGIISLEKINIDIDELHIMLFHKIALELGFENVETFGCRVNKNGDYYMLNIDSHVLNLLNGLKGADFVDVYVVHSITRQSNIQEQVKEKTDKVNLDDIPSDHVGIYSDFEDIYKDKKGRFEGNLGGDDPYFDSSDPNSDISEDERDTVENDKVVDPPPRNKSTKIYFDPTAKRLYFSCLLFFFFESY